jgi:hypothetical protein
MPSEGWRRWLFGRPDYSGWGKEDPSARRVAQTPPTDHELLERIASELATIRFIVVCPCSCSG